MKGGNDEKLQYADIKVMQQLSRGVPSQAEMGGCGQITFPEQADNPLAARSAAQMAPEVEYGQIIFAERPQEKNREMRPNGAPQASQQVEYGEIMFTKRPRNDR